MAKTRYGTLVGLCAHSSAHYVLSLCYLAAFLSYSVTFYGLLSPCGITPLPSPEEAYFHPQLLSFVGAFLSSITTISPRSRVFIFPALLLMYQQLLQGATSARHIPFYNFQWDLMLLEAGFVAVWQQVGSALHPAADVLTSHLARMMLFKLMFMSGLVKIQR